MLTAQDTAALATTLYTSFNERNFDKIVQIAEPNIIIQNMAFGTTLKGHAGVREWLNIWSTAMPDAKVEIVNIFPSEKGVVTEFIGRGTHKGPFNGPQGAIPATGKKLEMRFCEVLKIANDKVAEQRLYFDGATLLRQLGVIL